MEHIIGGYYLIDGRPHPPWIDVPGFPQTFWSISSCLAPSYPSPALLSWVTATADERAEIQAALQLSADAFTQLMDAMDRAFDDQIVGWPNVWLDVSAARAFAQRYLAHIPTVKLLGIAIPEPAYDQALAAHAPQHTQEGADGVTLMLRRRHRLDADAVLRGYEILGSERGGSFHSFVCNGLETAYTTELHIPLNPHGLIATYADAERASAYTSLATTGAEPVPWLPWLIFELPLGPGAGA